ncbi:hypothetical protein B0I12_003537 [Microbacterium hydrothermale]|uniref:hypothetical protein n=1 Tax=Microbacterium TaxID=33882 RepID=UPI001EF7F066|nr:MULTISPECIES: hypothetical protein [Microbacterium]MCG7418236.1 hypothetical protein [Microbacterium sp. ACRRU]MCW2166365.1 hypothetical protein [Microbacterium hydrothermale]MDI9893033.1 hypothetical protein [Microbacterium sp. IEGM 1404]
MSTPTNDDAQLSADEDSYEGADVEVSTETDTTSKPGGLGEDGTIPSDPNGVAAGHTGTASNFNPEEDEDAH